MKKIEIMCRQICCSSWGLRLQNPWPLP